jgi:hypothetical protein
MQRWWLGWGRFMWDSAVEERRFQRRVRDQEAMWALAPVDCPLHTRSQCDLLCRPWRDSVPSLSCLPRSSVPSTSLRAGSGLLSAAPPGLRCVGDFCSLRPYIGARSPRGLKPASFLISYAALKRRSSTSLHASDRVNVTRQHQHQRQRQRTGVSAPHVQRQRQRARAPALHSPRCDLLCRP